MEDNIVKIVVDSVEKTNVINEKVSEDTHMMFCRIGLKHFQIRSKFITNKEFEEFTIGLN